MQKQYYNLLHEFLFSEVYRNPIAKSEETKVGGIIEGIFEHFSANPEKLPDEYKNIINTEGVNRAVTDYIAGMTDHFAVVTFSNIYIPGSWQH